MINLLVAGCAIISSMMVTTVQAGSITVREVELKGNGTEILLDSNVDKAMVQVDFVRDVVQFSISNATIYPAKMLHADHSAFSKVFAYQYSPSLVRVRFTVENNAEQFKNKVKWSVDGKRVTIQFPAAVAASAEQEKGLLQRITGAVTEEPKLAERSKNEKKEDEKKEEKKEEKKAELKTVAAESHPLNLGNKKATKLGGAKSGPSVFRSFLAMFLVVGGLGLVLIYVKRKNSGGAVQAKKAGNSWISKVFTKGANQKTMMEVVATHVLGPKQSIVVMKIRGQQFVLAVTAENIQLITQLDSDEADLDLLDDPKVAASIGKMFGVDQSSQASRVAAPVKPTPVKTTTSSDANFNALLRNSTGAGAIIARNAYQSSTVAAAPTTPTIASVKPGISAGGARDMIRKRLEGIQGA